MPAIVRRLGHAYVWCCVALFHACLALTFALGWHPLGSIDSVTLHVRYVTPATGEPPAVTPLPPLRLPPGAPADGPGAREFTPGAPVQAPRP